MANYFNNNNAMNDLMSGKYMIIKSLKDIESILCPYIGMLFYVEDEEEFYQVISLKDGYSINGEVQSKPEGDYIVVNNVFIDKFELFLVEIEYKPIII